MIYTGIVVIITILCVLLVLVVLAQNPKGGGLSSEFGGSGGSSQMMGVKRTTDLLEKLTWGFAIGILALSLGANLMIDRGNEISEEGTTSKNIEKAKEAPVQQAPQQTQIQPEGEDDLDLSAPEEEE